MKSTHIQKATQVVKEAGINATFSGYSDSHGISVYFLSDKGEKVRVSTHSVSKKDRVLNEIHLNYPLNTFQANTKKVTSKFILTPEMIKAAQERKALMSL